MVLPQSSWIHGHSLSLEDHSWSVTKRGFTATVTTSLTSRSGWIHFAIPTPVIVNDKRLKFGQALILFRTGSKATIDTVLVYDGETVVGNFPNLGLRSITAVSKNWPIPGNKQAYWGSGITVKVIFGDDVGPDTTGAWVDFISVGIDYAS
jgi:hypothetical protein